MRTLRNILRAFLLLPSLAGVGGGLIACGSEEEPVSPRVATLTTEIVPFEGETMSRINVAGDEFLDNDYIRLKIICPFVKSTERGEYTDGNSFDSFFFFKRTGGSWVRLMREDGFDITGSYSPSDSPKFDEYYEAQQTPYVFIATTWTEERRFIAPTGDGTGTGHTLYDHLTPVFHADQTKEKHYRASDMLWSQTFMQTGTWNIHLGFRHKMACLDITIDDSALGDEDKITEDAVLTLEGMPDIDQAEIVVGDYYADASKTNSPYGYRQKASCSYVNNGRVLGIAVNDEAARRAKVAPLSGNPSPAGGDNSNYTVLPTIANDATYTAFPETKGHHFRLIVPPCVLATNATFWLRDGTRRYQHILEQKTFEEGKLYPITLEIKN